MELRQEFGPVTSCWAQFLSFAARPKGRARAKGKAKAKAKGKAKAGEFTRLPDCCHGQQFLKP